MFWMLYRKNLENFRKFLTWFLILILVFNDVCTYWHFIRSYISFTVPEAYAVNIPQPRIVDPYCNPVQDPTVAQYDRLVTPDFVPDLNSCVYSPRGSANVCAEGYAYDSMLGLCKKSPPDCPSDGMFIYNPNTKKCEEKIQAPIFQEGKELNYCKERCYDLRIDAKIEGLPGTSLGNGTADNCIISPNYVTRAVFAYLLVTALYGDDFSYSKTPYYPDVPPSHPYFKYIQKAKDEGLMTGVRVGDIIEFQPDKYMIRGDTYIVAVRYVLKVEVPPPGTYSETPYFPDVTSENYYFPYVQKAYELGLVVDVLEGDDLKPFDYISLTEIVKIFERAGVRNIRDVVCRLGSGVSIPKPVSCEKDGENLYTFDSTTGRCVSLFSLDKFPYYQIAYLYNNVLGRPPEGVGYSYWTTRQPCFNGEYSLYCLEWYIMAAIETLERFGFDAPCGIDLRGKPCHSVNDESGKPLSVKILAALIALRGTCPSVSEFDSYCNSKTVPNVDSIVIPSPGNYTNRFCPVPNYLMDQYGANALISGNLTQSFDFRVESDLRCSYAPKCEDGSSPRFVNGTYTCGETLLYNGTTTPMVYDWSSAHGTKSIKIKMKKGIMIEGIIRPYGEGCILRAYNLAICVSGGGSKLRFSFKHPEKDFLDLEVSLRPKWYNEFVAFITPEMMGLSVKDTGSGVSEFKEIRLGYAPVDKDDPSRLLTIDATLEPLRNNPFEIVVLKFYTYGQTKPFCPDKGIARCTGNSAIINIQQQGVNINSGSSTPSSTNQCMPAMISVRLEKGGSASGMVYSYNLNGYVEENLNNIGDMLRYSSTSPISTGLCLYWKASDDKTGFMQKLNRDGYVESYGYIFSADTPTMLGIYRTTNDFVGNIYFGRESHRKSSWVNYSIPAGFYTSTNTTLRNPGSNEVLTSDGYFEKYSTLCPSNQVELYQQTVYIPYGTESGTGKCYTYVEPASCYHSSMGGYDVDRFGDMCDLQVGVPDQCPSGTYLLTPYTSPSDDYKCEYRQSPSCPSGTLRIGGSCYYYTGTSTSYCYQNCGSSCYSCSYSGNGVCTCYYNYTTYRYADYVNGTYVCPSLDNCTLDYQIWDYCRYTCTASTTASACPSGYWYDSSTGLCLKYYGSACSSGYSYDSSRDICYYRIDASCRTGTRKCCDPESPRGKYSGCYITNTYVGPGTQYPSDQVGKIYCRNGLYFYKNRCYRYEGIACSGTYSESQVSSVNLIILGSSNSIGEWTGTCWRKSGSACEGSYIIRKPHTVGSTISTNTCGVLNQKVDFVSDLTSQTAVSDFEQALLRYFRRYYYGISSSDTSSFKINPYPYSSLIAVRGFFEEPNKFFCPLDNRIACAPLSGSVYICTASENFCAICTENIPSKIETNQVFASIYRIREFPDKVYGLSRFKYNYLGAYQMVNAINGARLPKGSEVSLIKSLFNIDSFWTEERVNAETNLEIMDNLVLVMSKDNFAFLAECLFGDDMNMICAADMVKCNGDVCPLGNYKCIPVGGVKYCSKYSWTCKNLADPSGWGDVEEYDPDPETDKPEDVDNEHGCLGQIYIFPGTALRCRPPGLYTGPRDCCDDDLVEDKEVPKDNFGGSPNVFLQFGISMSISIVTTLGQFMYRLYDIVRKGGEVALIAYISGNIISYKVAYAGKEIVLSPLQGEMMKAAITSASGGYWTTSADVIKSNFDKALAEGIKAYFGSAQFGYDVLAAIAPMLVNDPYGQAVVNIAMQALKMVLFPGTTPLGLMFAVANLVLTYFLMSCDAQDYQTVKLRRAGRCVRIGRFCIKEMPVLKVCLQWGVRYCCFNSKLARIIHEQGRPQLSTFKYSHSWGKPKYPNCRGFTPEEFQALDFGKIDFREYIEDIEREVKQKFKAVEQDVYKKMEDITKSRMPGGGN